MPVIKDNSIYEKTSFLSKSNSAFIENMYFKYISNNSQLPQGWKEFFDGLGEEKNNILNEIQGPSWTPKKSNIKKTIDQREISMKETSSEIISSAKDYEKAKVYFEKVINQFRPNNGKAEFYYGIMLIKLDNTKDGCNNLKKAIDLKFSGQGSIDVYNNFCK